MLRVRLFLQRSGDKDTERTMTIVFEPEASGVLAYVQGFFFLNLKIVSKFCSFDLADIIEV